jgi:hypothetical protein
MPKIIVDCKGDNILAEATWYVKELNAVKKTIKAINEVRRIQPDFCRGAISDLTRLIERTAENQKMQFDFPPPDTE